MGTVWVDATDLQKWKGPKTGISRVLDGVARELVNIPGGQAKLCVFDETAAAFRPFEPTEEANLDRPGSAAAWRRSRDCVNRLLSPLVRALPQEPRDLLRSIASHAYHLPVDAYRLARLLGRRLWQRGAARPATDVRSAAMDGVVEFLKGDVLLALGSTWGCRGYAEAVRKLKEERFLKVAHLIYDLIPVKFPHFYATGFGNRFERWAVNTLSISDLVLVASRHARNDIATFSTQIDRRCPPIAVIRLAEDILSDRVSSSAPALDVDLGPRFVLCVGTIEARKNHVLLYQVWSRLLETYGPSVPKLVIVGHPGLLTGDVLTLVKENPALRDHVVVLSNIKDPELAWLYEHCVFTVYPSIYEGWGLPVAESLAFGKYCVASATSSIPEIGGDLLDYHSPWDSGRCYELVERAMQDVAFLSQRECLIRERYKTTSWRETAESVLAAVRSHLA